MEDALIVTIIKTFFLNIFILILNFKIINKKINYKNIIEIIIISFLITAICAALKNYVDKLLLIIISYFIQLKFMEILKTDNNPILIVNLISNSIVYSIFAIAVILELPFIKIIKINNMILHLFIILIIELIILLFFTKIKRFKKGLIFFKYKNNEYINIILITISSIVILVYYLTGNYYENLTKQFITCLFVVGCIMFLLIQKTLTLYYKQKLLYQTIEDYKNEINEKDKKIKELSDEKYKISKLNHEFYNRQKALEKKVADYVSNVSVETANELAITEQIADLSKEYSDKLQNIKHPDKLPTTEIEEIDDMFKYMQSECEKNNIEFKLQINGNIHHMINQVIPKDKLVTLIGDHLRDAITLR